MRPRQLCRSLQVAFLSCFPLPRRECPWVLLPTPSCTRSRAQPRASELGGAGLCWFSGKSRAFSRNAKLLFAGTNTGAEMKGKRGRLGKAAGPLGRGGLSAPASLQAVGRHVIPHPLNPFSRDLMASTETGAVVSAGPSSQQPWGPGALSRFSKGPGDVALAPLPNSSEPYHPANLSSGRITGGKAPCV